MVNNTTQITLRLALTTEIISLAWMAGEFLLGVYAGLAAHSVLLIAFGLDSLLEIIAGGALIWRLQKERHGADEATIARAEARSTKLVGAVLFLLAAYVTIISIVNLVNHQGADTSLLGIIVAVVSVLFMPILAVAKRRLGQSLHSAALIEDGMCNFTCAYMAGTVLLGALATTFLGWWWADSVAALVLVYFIAREALEAFQDED
ncbi:cation transporter [Furfurilactobacillus sp. WILCCON 0119]|uniref:cation transporter n=1 Tax=Furfurilactobacillus entadae TaxID=2922307 RepID=UPI0035E4C3F6